MIYYDWMEFFAVIGFMIIAFTLYLLILGIWDWFKIEFLRFTKAWGYVFYAIRYHKEFKEFIKEKNLNWNYYEK